ncbi:MAG: bacteriohemerythrin [Rhizomicrobium sp.]
MPFLNWSDQYSVGIALFDAEHQRLVTMANELYDAVLSGTADETLRPIYLGLVAYCYRHFAHEEEFFAVAGYPFSEEHKASHAELRNEVDHFRDHLADTPKNLLAIEMAKFIKQWVTNHIMVHDRKYGAFLQEKGVH